MALSPMRFAEGASLMDNLNYALCNVAFSDKDSELGRENLSRSQEAAYSVRPSD